MTGGVYPPLFWPRVLGARRATSERGGGFRAGVARPTPGPSGVTLAANGDGRPARLCMDLIVDRQDNERRAAATKPTIRTVRGLAASTALADLGHELRREFTPLFGRVFCGAGALEIGSAGGFRVDVTRPTRGPAA